MKNPGQAGLFCADVSGRAQALRFFKLAIHAHVNRAARSVPLLKNPRWRFLKLRVPAGGEPFGRAIEAVAHTLAARTEGALAKKPNRGPRPFSVSSVPLCFHVSYSG